MDKALYIGMSGAKQNMLAQQAHANNLANVSTTGFKKDFAQARSMPVFGEHYPTRAYAMTERPGTDLSAGALMETGRKLDVSVEAEGWLAIQNDQGEEVFTRSGSLQVDVNGLARLAGHLFAARGQGNVENADVAVGISGKDVHFIHLQTRPAGNHSHRARPRILL